MKIKQLTTLKHKLQWLLLLAALLGVSQVVWADYYYHGEKSSWNGVKMDQSSDGTYWYYSASSGNHSFKITSKSDWSGTEYTTICNDLGSIALSGGSGNNIVCNTNSAHYIIIYSSNQKICASTSLPTSVTVRVKKEGKYKSTTPKLYAWDSTNNNNTPLKGVWNGTSMTNDATNNAWKISFSHPNSTYCIIINNNSDSDKTEDITGLSGNTCFSVDDQNNYSQATTVAPSVTTTDNAESITKDGATIGGNVSDKGSTAACTVPTLQRRGVRVYSNSTCTSEVSGSPFYDTTDGVGNYTVAVTGLSASRQYWYRAYAKNSNGTNNETTDNSHTYTFTTLSDCDAPIAKTFAVKSGSVLNLCSSSTYGAASTILKLEGSQSGYKYQLYRGDTPVGDAKDGTDSALEWSSISTAGTYKVIGYVSGDATCSTQMTGTPTVAVSTAPSYTSITSNASVCQGSAHTISLTSPANATTYQWKQGASTVGTNSSSYSIPSMASGDAGTYTCEMTNTGCTTPVVTSGSVVTYVAKPTPGTATAGGSSSTTVMYNGSTTIAVTDYTDGSDISWEMSTDGGANWSSASKTTASFTASSITTATMYRATITKSGCSDVTNEVTVNLTYRIRVKKNKILSNNAYIHIWESGTCNTTWGSCPAMTASDDGQWWYYDCSCNPAKILFKDATGDVTNNNHQTVDINRGSSSTVFCYEVTSNITDKNNKQTVSPADCCNTPTASGFTMSPTSVTYDGNSHAVTVSPESGYGAVSDIKYNGSSTAPTAVGDYTVTADIAAEGDWCAVNDLEIGTFSITKRSQATLSITTSTDNRCTGVLPLQLAVSGGSTSGTVTYAETTHTGTVSVSSSGEITASTDASITVTATMAGDATYDDVVSDPVTFTFTESPVIYLTGTGANGASATYPWEYMTITVDRRDGKTSPNNLAVTFTEEPSFSGGTAPAHSVTITGTEGDKTYMLKSAKTVNDAHYYSVKANGSNAGCAAAEAEYNVYINSAPAEVCE